MSSASDLDYIIHQDLPRTSKGEHRPMTVGAIIQHLARQKADKITDKERAYLRAFYAAKNQAGFIEDFLSIAVGDGRTLRAKSFKVGGEDGGWFGINRFFGLYVVVFSQYGEGQDGAWAFPSRKDADAVFGLVMMLNTPPV